MITRVRVHSETRPEFSRELAVIGITARNHMVLRKATEESWTPDLLVTVQDGCNGWGGQLKEGFRFRCEAELMRPGDDRTSSLVERGLRWWVSDHFQTDSVDVPKQLRDGDAVVPTQELGFSLVKRAKLAGDWGAGRWPPYLGATLFEVVRTDHTAPLSS